jgi:hypothetical protein
MRIVIVILLTAALTGCASFNQDNRSVDRIANVCVHNLLVRWMSSGAYSTIAQGDLKKAVDVVMTVNLYSDVCSENQETLEEDL